MSLPRWLGPGAVAFLAVWLLLLAAGRSALFRDPGTFWHTTTGERILADGFIRADPYTFTFAGTWWVPYQWLGEVGMALAHRAGGFDTQLLGAVTLIAAVFAYLARRLLRTGLAPAVVAVVLAVGLAAAGSHFHVRPHLFTLAATTATAVLLTEVDAGRFRLRALWLLPPLFAVWANVHGGVLAGVGTVGLTFAGWVAFWRAKLWSPVRRWREAGTLAAVLAACLAAPLLNPYGLDLLRTWHVIMGEPALKRIIQEHRPLDPAEPYAWAVFALAGLWLFALAGLAPSSSRARGLRLTWLLPAVWLVLACDRCRHAPLFAVVALVAVASVWPRTRWSAWLVRNRPDLQRRSADVRRVPLWANLGLPAAAVLLAFGLQVARVPVPVVGSGWAKHDPAGWPVDLLDVLKAHEPSCPGCPDRLFNEYIDGGFVIYHAPGYKVFVDDRCEVFGGDWLTAFVAAESGDTAAAVAGWETRYGAFEFALTRTGSGFDRYFAGAPGWEVVKATPTGTFYVRR